MTKTAMIQDSWTSETNPISFSSFDFEAIEKPTKALMHQAARFMYFNKGVGKIKVDGVEYDIKPHTLCAITPWKITDIIDVRDTLHLNLVVYDYQFINTMLKVTPGLEEESADLLTFLAEEPVVYLNDEQTKYVDGIMSHLQKELGVDSALVRQPTKPLSFLYSLVKIIELMVAYRRYFKATEEKVNEENASVMQNSILGYIYSHSSERLTLEKVAQVFFISESTLSKKLTDLTGITFIKLLNNIRIEKASDYLIYTDMKLEEIAVLLGFTDASHLSKHFVDKVGITPNKYRKIHSKVKSGYNRADKNVAFEVTNYLYKHYDTEKLLASSMAEKYGVSVSELNRSLLYYSEKNFETLLNFIRINKASELLISTTNSVLDIAVAVGYNNIKTFNLNFYKFKSMTPTEFRAGITLQKADRSESEFTG